VRNTGSVTGSTVAQLYLTFPESAPAATPIRQLRGFDKIALVAGEEAQVRISNPYAGVSVIGIRRLSSGGFLTVFSKLVSGSAAGILLSSLRSNLNLRRPKEQKETEGTESNLSSMELERFELE